MLIRKNKLWQFLPLCVNPGTYCTIAIIGKRSSFCLQKNRQFSLVVHLLFSLKKIRIFLNDGAWPLPQYLYTKLFYCGGSCNSDAIQRNPLLRSQVCQQPQFGLICPIFSSKSSAFGITRKLVAYTVQHNPLIRSLFVHTQNLTL